MTTVPRESIESPEVKPLPEGVLIYDPGQTGATVGTPHGNGRVTQSLRGEEPVWRCWVPVEQGYRVCTVPRWMSPFTAVRMCAREGMAVLPGRVNDIGPLPHLTFGVPWLEDHP
jgi:hypothetical protein